MSKTKDAQTGIGKKAQGLFADYPSQKAFYFTADGLAWFTEQEAQTHAAALKENIVQTIKRKDYVTKS